MIEIKCVYDKLVPIKDLKKNPKNPNSHPEKQIKLLAKIIEHTGFRRPLVVSMFSGYVVTGHGRLLAAEALGMEKVPVDYQDYESQEQEWADMVADNKIQELAELDEEAVAELMKEIDGFDLEMFGMEMKEAERMLNAVANVEEDNFDVDAELAKPAITKKGDLWLLGRHKLYCGDSTEYSTYSQLMGTQKADLVVTDPPYNVDYEGEAGKIKNDHMDEDAFSEFIYKAFYRMEKNTSNEASIYVFHSDTEGLTFRKAFDDAGFYLSGTCIWKKQSLVLGRSPYQWQHEPVLFGWKRDGKHNWYSDRKQSTIWEFDRPTKSEEHPTMKPVPLIAYPITNSSKGNDIVLDPFGGSGTTLIACEQLGRKCRMVELDVKYCDVIVHRYQELTHDQNVYVMRDGKKLSLSECLRPATCFKG